MKMFLGEYSPNVTEGSRIALPKRHREQITGGEVVMSKGFEKCVLVYDKSDWSESVLRQIDNAKGNAKTGDLERYLYASAIESPIDSQGRFVIPQSLRDYACIDGKSAVIGVGDHIEIWDFESWKAYISKVSARVTG
jgi:MraZ protein